MVTVYSASADLYLSSSAFVTFILTVPVSFAVHIPFDAKSVSFSIRFLPSATVYFKLSTAASVALLSESCSSGILLSDISSEAASLDISYSEEGVSALTCVAGSDVAPITEASMIASNLLSFLLNTLISPFL